MASKITLMNQFHLANPLQIFLVEKIVEESDALVTYRLKKGKVMQLFHWKNKHKVVKLLIFKKT